MGVLQLAKLKLDTDCIHDCGVKELKSLKGYYTSLESHEVRIVLENNYSNQGGTYKLRIAIQADATNKGRYAILCIRTRDVGFNEEGRTNSSGQSYKACKMGIIASAPIEDRETYEMVMTDGEWIPHISKRVEGQRHWAEDDVPYFAEQLRECGKKLAKHEMLAALNPVLAAKLTDEDKADLLDANEIQRLQNKINQSKQRLERLHQEGHALYVEGHGYFAVEYVFNGDLKAMKCFLGITDKNGQIIKGGYSKGICPCCKCGDNTNEWNQLEGNFPPRSIGDGLNPILPLPVT